MERGAALLALPPQPPGKRVPPVLLLGMAMLGLLLAGRRLQRAAS